jgi:hypothetical protein
MVHRLSWATIDQVLWSASNVLATVIAARALAPKQFGAYAVAIVTYTLSLGVFRALCLEALLVRPGHSPAETVQRRRDADGSGLLTGTAFFLVLVAGALIATGATRSCLVVVGLCLPGLFVQDAWRYGSFAVGGARRAAASDALWLVLAAGALSTLSVGNVTNPAAYVLAWGAAGTVAGVVPLMWARRLPLPTRGLTWIRSNLDLGGRYVVDYVCAAGAVHLSFFFLAAISGLTALGSLRAALTLYGPLSIVFTGAYVTLVPEGRRAQMKSAKVVVRFAFAASAAFLLLAAVMMGGLLLLPASVGVRVLGQSWHGARPLILPLGLSCCAQGAFVGPSAALRSFGDAPRVLRARMLTLPVVIGLPCYGAVLGGATGTSYGLAIAMWIAAPLYWLIFLQSVRETTENRLRGDPAEALDHSGNSISV